MHGEKKRLAGEENSEESKKRLSTTDAPETFKATRRGDQRNSFRACVLGVCVLAECVVCAVCVRKENEEATERGKNNK